LQRLRHEWELLSFRDGEHVDEFTLRLTGMMSSLAIHGKTIDEQEGVEKLLYVVPDKYTQLALSIETLLDTADLSIEEVAGRLKPVDDCEARAALPAVAEDPILSDGKLYFTEEQWLAQEKVKPKGDGGPKTSKAASNARRRPRGPHKKQGKEVEARDGGNNDDRNMCHNCGRYGHWAKDCRKPKKAQAHLTKADEEDGDSTLFMAQVCVLSVAPEGVFLDEPHTQAFLGATEDCVEHLEGWYLDTGATNHMTGRKDAFSNLDRTVVGSVKIADGSVVSIRVVALLSSTARMAPARCSLAFSSSLISGTASSASASSTRTAPRFGSTPASSAFGTSSNTFSPRYVEVVTVFTSCTLTLHVLSASLHATTTMTLGGGTFASATCPSTLCSTCPSLTWCAGCPSLSTSTSSATFASRQSKGALPSPRRPSTARSTHSSLVHDDVCGPISPVTPGGRRYFLLLMDDHTRYMWVVLISDMGDAAASVRQLQAAAEEESGRKLRVIRTDNGGEFTSDEFKRHYSDHGILHQLTVPYSPQQNNVVE
jgi:hypothetical protein